VIAHGHPPVADGLLGERAADQVAPIGALEGGVRRYRHPYADQLPDWQVVIYGGNTKDQAAADVDAWRRTLGVLGAQLGPAHDAL